MSDVIRGRPQSSVEYTRDNVPHDQYFTPDELFQMNLEALEELYMGIPDLGLFEKFMADALQSRYGTDRASDLQRLEILEIALDQYRGHNADHIPAVPIEMEADGSARWVGVSDRIQEHVQAGLPLETGSVNARKERPAPTVIGSIAAGVLVMFCLLFFGLNRLLSGTELDAADMTATGVAVVALTTTPGQTPTPTPLALDNIDRSIREGEDLRGYFPTTVEIAPQFGPSRLYPVQQREVDLADWEYDDNPEVATSILGFIIQPVLAIPYDVGNASFLSDLQVGDRINLRMSTGAELRFSITAVGRVNRQDSSIFEQSKPGIQIILVGDPSPDRLVVSGTYMAEQEAVRNNPLPTEQMIHSGQAAALTGEVTMSVLDTYRSPGPAGAEVSDGWMYLLTDIEIQVSGEETFSTSQLSISALDQMGNQFQLINVDTSIAHALPYSSSIALSPETTTRLTLAFIIPESTSTFFMQVEVTDNVSLTFQLPVSTHDELDASALDVLVLDVKTKGEAQGEFILKIRFFNPRTQTIVIRPSAVYVIFSPAVTPGQFPVGPATTALGTPLPLTVGPGQAEDIELSFPWNGDSWAGIVVGAYQYIAQLR